jgi:hypothetical protein
MDDYDETEEDLEEIQKIMETIVPKQQLERMPRFDENYFRIALQARAIYWKRKLAQN